MKKKLFRDQYKDSRIIKRNNHLKLITYIDNIISHYFLIYTILLKNQ